ncbi:S8 family serine peptidase [Neoroseomonas lacus]|uniref:Peptidase S8/S53 domain-containing protein n=1 Tax=Neoroseomonas lacus TaxID=287609 RepID=A0A917L228_9PROT|nr:S8 family serine peptidase [Neoroseomonas lacus]GGJ41068.1 hypothetical protein GCM10011320_55870 [Neoroseomonas lacus]
MSGSGTSHGRAQVIVELPNEPEMRQAFLDENTDLIARRMNGMTSLVISKDQVVGLPAFRIGRVTLPSAAQQPPEPGVERPSDAAIQAALAGLICVVEIPAERTSGYMTSLRDAGLRVGAQAAFEAFDHWVPNGDRPGTFHTRPAAEALIRADATRSRNLLGQGVNLVVVDEGFSLAALRRRAAQVVNYIDGWGTYPPNAAPNLPGQAAPDGHGTMVALNAISLAPQARLWDAPVRPPRINDVVPFADYAAAALIWIEAEIRLWLGFAFPGPWVFCHPWGIYDRRLEVPADSYTGDPNHILNLLFRVLDNDRDQVFAAGNGGQFAPHPRCGPGDIGPGQSILGGNSSPHILTIGAARADGIWIGYSSQGPGQPGFATAPGSVVEKPDLCAPSHFCEPTDAAWISSGTSAACGVAAGAVAALRSQGSPLRSMPPHALRKRLRDRARQPPTMAQTPYDLRFGYGILDLDAALR